MTASAPLLTLGTRGSPLALAQARMTASALREAHGLSEDAVATEIIRTTGDATQDRPLSEIGGKGLFTKEIDAAQLDGRVDLAVHSAKDLPTTLPDGLVVAGYLPRNDIRDALIAPRWKSLANLPQAAKVGTVSLRRQALLKRLRPDLVIEMLRGNVQTRLDKAANGTFDAVVLAMAGLNRLGLAEHATEALDPESFTPAVGQGAIALVAREGDARILTLTSAIAHRETGLALAAERAFLGVLDGSCRTPIGGSARLVEGGLLFAGIVLAPDGSRAWTRKAMLAAPTEARAAELGASLGRELRAEIPAGLVG
ncbi:MAG: hydroxymethylbilane synthase [Methylobacterium sp.]|nr:hydroxymethylbilane synthase [Methylobacterium sp.]